MNFQIHGHLTKELLASLKNSENLQGLALITFDGKFNSDCPQALSSGLNKYYLKHYTL